MRERKHSPESHSLQMESSGNHYYLLRARTSRAALWGTGKLIVFFQPIFFIPWFAIHVDFLLSGVYICSFKNVGKALLWQAVIQWKLLFQSWPCIASCPLICHQLPPVFCEVFPSLLRVAQQKVSSQRAPITIEPVQVCLMETFLLQSLSHSFYLSHKTSSV